MDCIFCKIIKGEIPSYRVYEDNNFFAFLDIKPLNPGHVLVIPKKHYRWVWDVENIGDYFKTVGKLAKTIKKAFNTDYVVSTVFGEAVHHAHVHLVPRFPDDGHGDTIVWENMKKISQEEMNAVMEKIKSAL